MGYSYDYSYASGEAEGVLMLLLGFYGVVWGIMMLLGIALYIIRSLSVYTIAKRRGLENPWLSWLPVGHEWILGSLSDQYKYITQKKVQNRRKVLLGLGIASLVCGVLMGGTVVTAAFMAAVEEQVAAIGVTVLCAMFLSLAAMVLSIVQLVFTYMCKYDLYKSCDPKNAVAYLVVSIFIGVTEPFFLLCCRKKDLGMTPEEQPAATPKAEPAAEETPAEETPAEPAALPDGTPAALPAAAESETADEVADEPADAPAAPIILPAAPAVADEPEDEVPAEE